MQEGGEPESIPEFAERLPNVVEACADRIDQQSLIKIKRRSITPLKKRIRAPAKALTVSKNFSMP